jgi:cardiolipin synthase (CMP-forming)
MNKFNDKSFFSIPNLLSFYRIFSFPAVVYFAFKNNELIYFILLLIDLITDVLDGFIARKFNLQTEFGARLDALADIGMYILAFLGVIIFKANELEPYLFSLLLFFTVFVIPKIISWIKFSRFPSLHLFSSKIGGYLQGFFFLYLFVFGFSQIFYYIMIIFGILSFIEQIIIVLIVKDMKSNMKGLLWILNNKQLTK